MRLASHLGLSLQRCKHETTSMEFVVWNAYLNREAEEEIKRTSKTEYYLAQIAMEVRKTLTPKAKLSLSKFLLHFKLDKKVDLSALSEEEYEEAKKAAAERAKFSWRALLGGYSSKNKKDKPCPPQSSNASQSSSKDKRTNT
jgi:hypothetical protein